MGLYFGAPCLQANMAVSINERPLFGSAQHKDYSVWGSIWGPMFMESPQWRLILPCFCLDSDVLAATAAEKPSEVSDSSRIWLTATGSQVTIAGGSMGVSKASGAPNMDSKYQESGSLT